jgi:flagellar hook-basal body complex protein FliE
MSLSIDPVSANLRLAQLLADDPVTQVAQVVPAAPTITDVGKTNFTGNPFEDILSKAVAALEGVSHDEIYANQLIDKYIQGEAELQDVMVAQSKASVMVQLAVTTVNSAVSTLKEVTQMQV